MFKQKRTISFPLSWNLSSTLIFWDVSPLPGISDFCYNFLPLVTKAAQITAESMQRLDFGKSLQAL